MKSDPVVVDLLKASVPVLVAVIGALVAYFTARRDRRRSLYGEAVKAALSWHEMLYRVRRRTTDNESDLVVMFHDLQERITYYQGWIGSESEAMERSYASFVLAIKAATEPHITAAWQQPIRATPGNATPDDVHPDVTTAAKNFTSDVRLHLSPFSWLWRERQLKNRHVR